MQDFCGQNVKPSEKSPSSSWELQCLDQTNRNCSIRGVKQTNRKELLAVQLQRRQRAVLLEPGPKREPESYQCWQITTTSVLPSYWGTKQCWSCGSASLILPQSSFKAPTEPFSERYVALEITLLLCKNTTETQTKHTNNKKHTYV